MPQETPKPKKKPAKYGPKGPNDDVIDLMRGVLDEGPKGSEYFNPRGRGPSADDTISAEPVYGPDIPPPTMFDNRNTGSPRGFEPQKALGEAASELGDTLGSFFGSKVPTPQPYVRPQEPPAPMAPPAPRPPSMADAEEKAYRGAQGNIDYEAELAKMFAENEAEDMAAKAKATNVNMGGVRTPEGDSRYKPTGEDALGRTSTAPQVVGLPPEFTPEAPTPAETPEPPGALELELSKLQKEASQEKPTGLLDALAVLGTGLSGVGAERTMGVADRLQGGPEKRTAKDRALKLAMMLEQRKGQQEALGARNMIAQGNMDLRRELVGERGDLQRELQGQRLGSQAQLQGDRLANRYDIAGMQEQGKEGRLDRSIAGRQALQEGKPEKGMSYRDLLALQNNAMKDIDSQIGVLDRAASEIQSNGMMLPQEQARRLASIQFQRQRLSKLRTMARGAIAQQIQGGSVPTSALDIPDVAKQYDDIYNQVMMELKQAAGAP